MEDPRIRYGRSCLQPELEKLTFSGPTPQTADLTCKVDPLAPELLPLARRPEGFAISIRENKIRIIGFDAAGILYGCLALKEKISLEKGLPPRWQFCDAPDMKLRGTCILLMKLGTYNYPITPREFPFFYDKELWLSYLDFLVENRFNYIAFWNGHPFDYFVQLEQFPEAQEGMPEGLVEKNHAMLQWLCAEGKKRNIRFIFQFYNIHTSVYFQKAHHLPDESSIPTPLLSAYTAYTIERFVSEFPGVGLYITPGEALELEYTDKWINQVILPAVRRSGKMPPVFIRAWGIDLEHAAKIDTAYTDLYWERKFNVEMIADTRPDPENKSWAALNGNFILNIHCIANLEPFRWNPPGYIQKIIQNAVKDGANGLHLYPRKAWRWPYGCDTGDKMLQWERDALWFMTWGRYAWKGTRQAETEKSFWLQILTKRFGSEKAATHFYESFRAGADVLPGLQRLIWLGYDNHTVVASGIKMSQLEGAEGIPFWKDIGCLRIPDYLNALKKGDTLTVKGPVEFLSDKIAEAEKAVLEAQKAVNLAERNQDEASRILGDASAILLITRFYYYKLRAVIFKLLSENNIYFERNRDEFVENLQSSLASYRELTSLTALTYESISDVPAKHPEKLKICPYHWSDILPVFEKELIVYEEEMRQPVDATYFLPALAGLGGIWYGDPGLKNADHYFTTDTLLYNWDHKSRTMGRNWSAHWFGFIRFPVTGKVYLTAASDRGVLLMLDGKQLITPNGRAGEQRATFSAEKDQWVSFEMIYNHAGGTEGHLYVKWQLPGAVESDIPADCLKHSVQQQRKMEEIKTLLSGAANEN